MSGFVEEITQDVRFGVRRLLKKPGFTLLLLITLAVGIGANTAVFSVIRGVLIRPLPYPDADRLVFVLSSGSDGGSGPASGPDFLDWRASGRSFEGLAAYVPVNVDLTGDGEPERLAGARVSAAAFDVFGVQPAFGRSFLASDEVAMGRPAVVLSDGLWKRRYGGSPAVLGTGMLLNGETHTIIGIMPPLFNMPAPWSSYDVWQPLPTEVMNAERGWGRVWVVGRLAQGQSVQAAEADLGRIAAVLAQRYPETNTGKGVRVIPLKTALVGNTGGPLVMLLAAAGLVLLIVCTNIGGLLAASTGARRTEFAIRSSLGASSGRLVRQLLTECLMLSVVGGGAGVLLGDSLMSLFRGIIPNGIPRVDEIGIDWLVLGFTGAVSVATGLTVGLIPALAALRPDLNRTLKEGGIKHTSGTTRGRVRGVLVVWQVALTVLLANAAALMLKSYLHLRSLDLGFDPRNVVVMALSPQGPKYSETEHRMAFYGEIMERVRGLPGVIYVGATSKLPLEGGSNTKVMIQGREAEFDQSQAPLIELSRVFPEYVRAMGIPLLSGRDLEDGDFSLDAPAILINREMARRFWPDENPVGKRVSYEMGEPQWLTVVGVVGDTRQWGIEHEPVPEMFIPYTVLPRPRMFLTVKTATDPMEHMDAIGREIRAVDSDLPVTAVRTMEHVLERSVARRRFSTFLVASFAVIGLVVISSGIYGIVSYHVAQGTREIGIRMALGAGGNRVVGGALLRGMKPTGLGVLLGLVGVFAIAKITSRVLYGVSPTDPMAIAVGTLLIIMLAFTAALIPSQRAATVSPAEVLRTEP